MSATTAGRRGQSRILVPKRARVELRIRGLCATVDESVILLVARTLV